MARENLDFSLRPPARRKAVPSFLGLVQVKFFPTHDKAFGRQGADFHAGWRTPENRTQAASAWFTCEIGSHWENRTMLVHNYSSITA